MRGGVPLAGQEQPDAATPRAAASGRSIIRLSFLRPTWAGLLSLAVPGLGQVYARRMRSAAWFATASFALSGAFLVLMATTGPATVTAPVLLAVLALALATLVLNVGAAVHASRAMLRPHDFAAPGWRRSTWTWGLVLGGITLGFELLPAGPGWEAFSVPSASMLPTLEVGDRFVVITSDAAQKALAPGDVIVFLLPRDHSVDYVKRLVALPGQEVQMRRGRLYIDGNEVPHRDLGAAGAGVHRWRLTLPNGRSYVTLKRDDGGMLDDTPPVRLGADQLFVMGDNLDDSLDSRAADAVGPVPRDLVVGRAAIIFWSRNFRRLGTPL